MNANVHFSSATDQWSTPRAFAAKAVLEFGINFDVCADSTNAVVPDYFTVAEDALSQKWEAPGRVCWMNCPYGKAISLWVAKASWTASNGTPVVCLLPARPDTRYWANYIWDHANHRPYPGVELRFIKGRLKFGDSKSSAPFPSALVIFRGPAT